jgi:protein phosphatase
MTETNNDVELQSASVTDRGLSEKRPLNEDSFLADSKRRIFAVADGVGGAQAGEVASQTAMEVLDEAFRHQTPDADIEDLMEIAIQRANASIHRMSHEHPKLSMMATTIVALHLSGRTATIGHVGDSRLYRLAPDGTLHRETQDHSVVEEEVRAGRMTAAQAANHPSRNVISRALGAEDTVEVDLKTFEVDDGTSFLLCSDGITRHVDDSEIRNLLASPNSPDRICDELKRLCFERGAEDNLTAIIVRVGAFRAPQSLEDERTISSPNLSAMAQNGRSIPETSIHSAGSPVTTATPPAVPVTAPADRPDPEPHRSASPPQRNGSRGFVWFLVGLVFIAAAGAAGFMYGRQRTEQEMQARLDAFQAIPSPTVTPEDPASAFEKKRRQVDSDPQGSLRQMSMEGNGDPLSSSDPQFLYLYGRALLLSGKPVEANEAFKKTIDALKDRPARDPMRVEAKMAGAVAALRTGNWQTAQTASKALEEVIQSENQTPSPTP